jgi:hypothetical protein
MPTRPTPPWPFFISALAFSLVSMCTTYGRFGPPYVAWILLGTAAVLVGYGIRFAGPLVRANAGAALAVAAAAIGCAVVVVGSVLFQLAGISYF